MEPQDALPCSGFRTSGGIGSGAPSREHVDAFWTAGTAAEHALSRAAACSFSLVPGEPSRNIHLGFGPGGVRRDPDGNTVEGVHRA
jgi:hypothetical protein